MSRHGSGGTGGAGGDDGAAKGSSGAQLFPPAPPVVELTATVRAALAEHWPSLALTLSKGGVPIKASQNVTWAATQSEGDEAPPTHIVRATPVVDGGEPRRIEAELDFVTYVAGAMPGQVCAAVPPDAYEPEAAASADAAVGGGRAVVARDDAGSGRGVVIALFEYAKGAPLDYGKRRWLSDSALVQAWGRFMGTLHLVSRKYSEEFPARAARVRPWTELHDGVMREAAESLAKEDADSWEREDVARVGILHGDVNPGNFFVNDGVGGPVLCVYDWDQLQRAWYTYDVALVTFSVHMLARAGSFPSPAPVGGIDERKFVGSLIRGYEAARGATVDVHELRRMTALRREFYERFCRRAMRELAPAGELVREDVAGMYAFVKFVVDWLDREAAAPRARVTTFNLLARAFTHWNSAAHKCTSAASELVLESLDQTRARYRLATEAILMERADCVCLQECEEAFLDPERGVNPAASELMEAYCVAGAQFGPPFESDEGWAAWVGYGGGSGGTAVLVRRASHGGRLRRAAGGDLVSVPGSDDTGGSSKSAVAVPLEFASGEALVVASLHAAFGDGDRSRDERQVLLDRLQEGLSAAGHAKLGPIVVAGDFNAGASVLTNVCGLTHVPLAAATCCGGTFDHACCIDHFFVSPTGLIVEDTRVERTPSSPYDLHAVDSDGAAVVVGASDHVWASTTLMIAPGGADFPTRVTPWPAVVMEKEPATESVKGGESIGAWDA